MLIAARGFANTSILVKTSLMLSSVGLGLGLGPGLGQTPPAINPATPPGMMPYVAILEPQFVPAAQAGFLRDEDIVIGVAHGKVAKAYPAGDLAQHGSVNDRMPDEPIEVTWCGVCQTGVVFRAKVKGRLLHFDYDSMVGANEVHRDRETGSRWQQSTGEAISGPLKGAHLDLYPFVRTNWKEWHRRYPNTVVLKPLPGYDERMANISKRTNQVALTGEGDAPKAAFGHDDRLRPREVVAGLRVGEEEKAYPFSQLRIARVINDSVGGTPVLMVHQRSSDTTTAFDARVKGHVLRFEAADAEAGSLLDTETHSKWDAYGECREGRWKGARLKALILIPEFWFAWSEFHPQTKVFLASGTQSNLKPQWEILMQAPLPEDAEPKVTVLILPMRPAPPHPGPFGAHRHAGPVFAYILQGEIENQVEPEAPQTYKPGGYFYEPPMHLHSLMRNLSQTEAAKVIVFQAGATGKASPVIQRLLEAPLATTVNEEISLGRLTLPPGSGWDSQKRSGTGVVYVLEGAVQAGDKKYGAGEVFVDVPAHALRNAGSDASAKVLVYQVSEKRAD